MYGFRPQAAALPQPGVLFQFNTKVLPKQMCVWLSCSVSSLTLKGARLGVERKSYTKAIQLYCGPEDNHFFWRMARYKVRHWYGSHPGPLLKIRFSMIGFCFSVVLRIRPLHSCSLFHTLRPMQS